MSRPLSPERLPSCAGCDITFWSSSVRSAVRTARVNLIDDSQCRQRVLEVAAWARFLRYRPRKVRPFERPRLVGSRIFVDGRVRRPNLGPHPIVDEALGAVASAEAFELQLGAPRVDLER